LIKTDDGGVEVRWNESLAGMRRGIESSRERKTEGERERERGREQREERAREQESRWFTVVNLGRFFSSSGKGRAERAGWRERTAVL